MNDPGCHAGWPTPTAFPRRMSGVRAPSLNSRVGLTPTAVCAQKAIGVANLTGGLATGGSYCSDFNPTGIHGDRRPTVNPSAYRPGTAIAATLLIRRWLLLPDVTSIWPDREVTESFQKGDGVPGGSYGYVNVHAPRTDYLGISALPTNGQTVALQATASFGVCR